MKALIAWWLVSLTYHTRPMYMVLSDIARRRVTAGTNPLRTLRDGALWVLVGLLQLLIVPVGLLTFPVSSLWLMAARPDEWAEIRRLVAAGRVDWATGTILEVKRG